MNYAFLNRHHTGVNRNRTFGTCLPSLVVVVVVFFPFSFAENEFCLFTVLNFTHIAAKWESCEGGPKKKNDVVNFLTRLAITSDI